LTPTNQSIFLNYSKGNLYGTTVYGGDLSCTPNNGEGCGVIFELKP